MNRVETSIRQPGRTQSPTVKICWLDNWFMIIQVHPAIIFYKMSVRRSKIILPIIFYHLRTAKIFLMTVLFMFKFRSLSNKFSTTSWSLILHISLPRLGYFCRKKEGLWEETFHLKAVSGSNMTGHYLVYETLSLISREENPSRTTDQETKRKMIVRTAVS